VPASPTSLQEWGEKSCGLAYARQLSVYKQFVGVVLAQGAIFWLSKQRVGLVPCGVLIAGVACRLAVLCIEGNWGWLVGVAEGVVIWLTVAAMNCVLLDPWSGLMTLLLACLRQFGLARHCGRGLRLVGVVKFLMYFLLATVVGAVLLSVAPPEKSTWSAFENHSAKNYSIWYKEPPNMTGFGPPCRSNYELAGGGSLSLGDFGLLSAVAYESKSTMPEVLRHYFPGWSVLPQKRIASEAKGDEGKKDWTTFFEYADPSNTTSVFTVRGTDTTLDVLNDINIWMPVVLLQAFSLLGPQVTRVMAKAITQWSTVLGGIGTERYFSEFEAHVKKRLKEEPWRRFFLTGHSLGGGLAKLVAARLGIQAVTFMAPGLGTTGYFVYDESIADKLHYQALTVQPENDLVSRVDVQQGTVVPVNCSQDPLTCHQIYQGALCELFTKCGSMRPGRPPVLLPCDYCEGMDC